MFAISKTGGVTVNRAVTPSENKEVTEMAGYFSFHKNITGYFVKTTYALGFVALTVGGIGFAAWAGLRLNEATIPTRKGVYFIVAGAGVALIGNLVWRMICEFWLLLFNMQALLATIEHSLRLKSGQAEPEVHAIEEKTTREVVRPERTTYPVTAGRGVLGLP